jgi:hypothetical protein
VALSHGDLAGVPGLALDDELVAMRGRDALHDAQARPAPSQLVARLDVDLDVGRDPPERRRAVEACEVVEGGEVGRARRRGVDSAGVAHPGERLLGQRARHEPRADRARAEARRLLGRAHEHAGAAAERRPRLQREHGAQRAVVAPAAGHGVDVRARGDDRAVAGRQRPKVAVGVDGRRQAGAGAGRPAGDQAHRRGLGVRVRGPVGAAARGLRDLPQRLEAGGDPRPVEPCGGVAPNPHGVVLSPCAL